MNEKIDIKFQERYVGGLRRTYVITPWPHRIEVTKCLATDIMYFDRSKLWINCANGSAIYAEKGSDADIWRGELVETRGENPVETETSA